MLTASPPTCDIKTNAAALRVKVETMGYLAMLITRKVCGLANTAVSAAFAFGLIPFLYQSELAI
jgi:hypothetical protein